MPRSICSQERFDVGSTAKDLFTHLDFTPIGMGGRMDSASVCSVPKTYPFPILRILYQLILINR